MGSFVRILFVGVLDVNWSTNLEMKKALLALGHEVDKFNYRTIEHTHIPAWQNNIVFKIILNKLFSFLRRFERIPIPFKDIDYSILGRK